MKNKNIKIPVTGFELDNFFATDKKLYELKNNKQFINFLKDKTKQGYSAVFSIGEMQQFINDIANFYEFKYPNAMFFSSRYPKEEQHCEEIAKLLNFKQLIYRLDHYWQLFDINYIGSYRIKKIQKENILEIDRAYVNFKENGYIDIVQLETLQNMQFIKDINGIKNIYDLIERLRLEGTIDYQELEKAVLQYQTQIEIRNKLLRLTIFKILYSDIPTVSYPRVKSFIRTFNKELGTNLSIAEVDELLSFDYSKEKSKQHKLVLEQNKCVN